MKIYFAHCLFNAKVTLYFGVAKHKLIFRRFFLFIPLLLRHFHQNAVKRRHFHVDIHVCVYEPTDNLYRGFCLPVLTPFRVRLKLVHEVVHGSHMLQSKAYFKL